MAMKRMDDGICITSLISECYVSLNCVVLLEFSCCFIYLFEFLPEFSRLFGAGGVEEK